MATDPVCGMSVDEKDPPASSEYAGRMFYFCGEGCKQTFDADPEAYSN